MIDRLIQWLLNLPGEPLAGSWRLALTAEYSSYLSLAILLGGLLAGWLVIRSYRREGTGRRGLRSLLAALRLAVILLVVVALFRPAVVVQLSRTLHSTVLLVIDASSSMSLTDRYGESPQGDPLSEALGVSREQLADLTREQVLTRRLRDSRLIETLRRDHPVAVLRFSTDQPGRRPYTSLVGEWPVLDETPATTRPMDSADALGRIQPIGHQTRLSSALRDALERFRGRRIGAVVLLSDAQPTDPHSDERISAAVEWARQQAVPRYGVCVGDPTPPKQLAVTDLRAAEQLRAGAKGEFTATLTHRNLAGQSVEVRLVRRRPDATWPADLLQTSPVAASQVTLQADDDGPTTSQSLTLTHQPGREDIGEWVYRAVVVPPGGVEPDDSSAGEVTLRVSDDKIRILLISSDAGWEFRYLRNYFLRQPELYRLSVWQQNADEGIEQSSSPGMAITRLPRTVAELLGQPLATTQPTTAPTENRQGYHVVVLIDPAPTAGGVDKPFLDQLKRFVTVHRGGLCYIASGRHSWEVLSDPAAKALANLLPVTVARNRVDVARIIQQARPQAWPCRLSDYGVDHPITRLESKAAANREIWQLLPGFYFAQAVASIKPAARLLLAHGDPSRKTLHGRAEPILAVHAAGSGRVAYLGSDETWRWRFVDDGFYHRRFWGNLVRYLAPFSARQVVIVTGRDRFDIGEPVDVEVEAFNRDYQPLTQDTLPLIVRDLDSGERFDVILPAVADQPGRFAGRFTPPHVGRYELSVREALAPRDRVTVRAIAVERPRAEFRRTEASPLTLARIVSRPEYLLQPAEMERLDEMIPTGRLQAVDRRDFPLWDTPAMLILLAVLLGVEWFIRKRVNMA
jgi:hypothetical protein